MSAFFDRYSVLCREKGETPNSLGKKLGIPSGSITAWKKGTIPRMQTLDMLASYFRVSVDYLIGNVNDPFFYLDNERIKNEINSYDDKGKTPAIEGDHEFDDDIPDENYRILSRNAKKLSPEQRQQLLELARIMFKEEFKD